MLHVARGLLALALGSVLLASTARAQEAAYTRADVASWADAYGWWYETPAWPHDALVQRVLAVAACETGGWDVRVINNVRRGRFGEVGVGQWLPGPRSIWQRTPQAQAGYPVTDVEANVAGLVWAVSVGLGPSNWSCWA